MSVLHKVEDSELVVVSEWLGKYLPDSWSIYHVTKAMLSGRWEGQTFYTLGWPDIRGVASGKPEPNHPCAGYYSDLNYGFMYAPKDDDVMALLNQPEVMDWSKRFVKAAIPQGIYQCLERMAKAKGVATLRPGDINVFYAKPEDLIQPRPVPEGCQLRPLRRTDSEIEYCVSTWSSRTCNADKYVRALAERFPSACVADDQDKCLSFEIGTEYGSIGFLYTREEARGKGLAKAVIGRLAEEYHQLGLDLYACVIVGAEESYSLHSNLGFKDIGHFHFANYRPQ